MRSGKKIPKIGARIVKSSAAVALCMLVYCLRMMTPVGNGIPFYSALAALWCMQPYHETTKQMALQRTAGTITGAAYGLIVLVAIRLLNADSQIIIYFAASAMLIPVIHTTVILNKRNASFFSCVVFLSIVLTHSFDDNPFLFVLDRMLDTFIGIFIGIAVNEFRLPGKKDSRTLYISGIDSVLIADSPYSIPYSKVELNRLISEGMMFTISTVHTPSELIPLMSGVDLKLPVVVMDGAAVFDISDNSYFEVVTLDHEVCCRAEEAVKASGLEYFVSVLCDHTILNYYSNIINEAERKYFQQQKRSPYCNYIHSSFRNKNEKEKTICLTVMAKTDEIAGLKKELEKLSGIRITVSECDCSGFLCLKVYSSLASKKKMAEKLKLLTGADNIITVGSIKENYDVYIEDGGGNNTVKILGKLYRKRVQHR